MPPNDNQLTSLLVPVLIFLGGGILVIAGWLIWLLARPKKAEPAETASQPPAETVAAGAGDVEPPQIAAPSSPYFLAVRRDPKDGAGGWEITINGEPYRALEEVPDPETQAEVIDALRTLAGFARSAVQQQRRAGAATTSSRPTAQSLRQPEASRPPVPAPVSGSDPTSVAGAQLTARPVTSSSGMIPTIDFAHEIGTIVDEMMAQEPTLQGHAVRLTNLPGGGLTFAVDGKVYREIGDIPAPEIRELIRRATREWERR